MKLSHVHCRVHDLPAAARWFEEVWQVSPVFHNERMVWLSFGQLGVILDAAPADSTVTLGFDSEDCDADYRTVPSRAAARKRSRRRKIGRGAPAPPILRDRAG
jgi:hypothetical protein